MIPEVVIVIVLAFLHSTYDHDFRFRVHLVSRGSLQGPSPSDEASLVAEVEIPFDVTKAQDVFPDQITCQKFSFVRVWGQNFGTQGTVSVSYAMSSFLVLSGSGSIHVGFVVQVEPKNDLLELCKG